MSHAGSTSIPVGRETLDASLDVPDTARAVVVFAHGAGSSRLSPRNVRVAQLLRSTGEFGTLLFDLLTSEEDRRYEHRFDIDLLAERLAVATRWARIQTCCHSLPVAYFGASTGAAAALRASVALPDIVIAVVSRGGRPDLAGASLAEVRVPVLLIVGGADTTVLRLNESARQRIPAPTELEVIPRATHLFEEPGALDEVAHLTLDFLERHLPAEEFVR